MTEKRLVPVSMDLLYNGMIVMYDIFDYSATHLLIKKGNTLKLNQIDSIKRINGGNDIIYVTQETYRALIERSLGHKTELREEIEDKTGYSEIKDETLDFLKEIEDNNEMVRQEVLHTVSDKLSEQLAVTKPDVIVGLINALAPVDEYLQRHCVNVSLLNGLMGKWLNFPKETIDTLVLVGLLHDCGKAALPRQIMSAPRPLTIVEFEVVKMHTIRGYEMLTEFPETIRNGARSHHEKYNGSGYPDGLTGLHIPFLGRITAISDIYDAMTARRSYKPPNSPFFVLSLLKKISEKELDPVLVDLFLENMPKEFIGKPVVMSNGEVGLVHSIDPDNIEYPVVRVGRKKIKCNEGLKVTSMYFEEKEEAEA